MASMLEAQRRISRKAFFSTKRLAETITYNGKEIAALAYVGASLARTDWNDVHTSVEHANLADIAVFCVCDEEEDENGVPMPQEGDYIIYHGQGYAVANIIEHDTAGSHWVVMATKAEKPFGR